MHRWMKEWDIKKEMDEEKEGKMVEIVYCHHINGLYIVYYIFVKFGTIQETGRRLAIAIENSC